jgi:hypothetical protein
VELLGPDGLLSRVTEAVLERAHCLRCHALYDPCCAGISGIGGGRGKALIDAQRRVGEKRMGEFLLATPGQPTDGQPGQAFPGGEIYLSFPGLGRRLAARIAGEIGEHTEQFTTPNSLQWYAGRAPVTRRSGKRDLVVAHRLACNRYLADAVHKWAFASLRRSAWAREFYDAQRARGKNHHAALRALGNRWSKSCGTASPTTCPTTRPSTSPTATGPSAR